MNQATVVNEVSKRSGEQREVCRVVMKGYEKYCEHNITRSTSKYMDAIVAFVSTDTEVSSSITKNIIANLLEIVQAQVKSKIPFVSRMVDRRGA